MALEISVAFSDGKTHRRIMPGTVGMAGFVHTGALPPGRHRAGKVGLDECFMIDKQYESEMACSIEEKGRRNGTVFLSSVLKISKGKYCHVQD